MGLRIRTNVPALTAQRHLQQVGVRIYDHFRKLSSGLRIETAADDPAGLGISERMRAKLGSLDGAARNIEDGISLLRTAEGALAEIGDLALRLRELTIRAATGTLSDVDVDTLDAERRQTIEAMARIAETTDFNGIGLLDERRTLEIQVGTDAGETLEVELFDLTPIGLFAGGPDFSTPSGVDAVRLFADRIIDFATGLRGRYGANENALASALRANRIAGENLTAAESRIRDVDVARMTAELARDQIIQLIGIRVLNRTLVDPIKALELLTPVHASAGAPPGRGALGRLFDPGR